MRQIQLSDITWLTLVAAFAVTIPNAAPAQLPQSFETAVIRPTQAAANAGTSVELFPGGRIKIVNEPVKLLFRMAFQLQNAQIAGGPDWLETGRYDIEAKTGLPEKIKPDQLGVDAELVGGTIRFEIPSRDAGTARVRTRSRQGRAEAQTQV